MNVYANVRPRRVISTLLTLLTLSIFQSAILAQSRIVMESRDGREYFHRCGIAREMLH